MPPETNPGRRKRPPPTFPESVEHVGSDLWHAIHSPHLCQENFPSNGSMSQIVAAPVSRGGVAKMSRVGTGTGRSKSPASLPDVTHQRAVPLAPLNRATPFPLQTTRVPAHPPGPIPP